MLQLVLAPLHSLEVYCEVGKEKKKEIYLVSFSCQTTLGHRTSLQVRPPHCQDLQATTPEEEAATQNTCPKALTASTPEVRPPLPRRGRWRRRCWWRRGCWQPPSLSTCPPMGRAGGARRALGRHHGVVRAACSPERLHRDGCIGHVYRMRMWGTRIGCVYGVHIYSDPPCRSE